MLPTASTLLNRLLARGKLRHVQVLLKLAELGSVQRTADAIGLTQSAVTQTLATVEQLVETRLFQRHARGVRPTPACNDLLPIARQVLLGIQEFSEVVAAHQRQGQGVVRLAASEAATHGLLAGRLARFSARFPGIQVHLRSAEGDDQLLAIARGEVDLVACRQPETVPEGWIFVPLVDDAVVAVAAAGHPLARRRQLGSAELARATWLLTPAGSLTRQHFDAFVATLAEPPPVEPLVSRSLELMVETMEQRGALCLLPWSLVRNRVERRQLARLNSGLSMPLRPLGLLQPAAGPGEAAARLADDLAGALRRVQGAGGGARRDREA